MPDHPDHEDSSAGLPTGASESLAETTLVGGPATLVDDRAASRCRPAQLGRYLILETLGEGGMGTVYAALDPTLGRRIALKVLRSRLAGRRPVNAQPRLLREARALAKLSHPNIVAVYDVGLVDGDVFLAMELARGETLAQWQRAPRTWRETLHAYLEAGRGLAAAHASSLVHRDFKPANVIIDDEGRVRVLDFGLAIGEHEHNELDETVGDDITVATRLTATGLVMGTPAYMAPEQLRGEAADPRSDQFGFCVALFEALHGHRPFVGRSVRELIAETSRGRRRGPGSGKKTPRWLLEALDRGLSPDPSQRFPTMRSLLDALDPVRRRRKRQALGVTTLGAVAVAGVLGLQARAARTDAACSSAADKIAASWSAEQRRDLERSIEQTGVAYARETSTRVNAGLDEYAQRWVTSREEACLAARRGVQTEAQLDLRMRCLDDRHAAFDALVEVLSDADAEVVQHAATAVVQLPSLARCEDLEALAAAVPPLSDPEDEAEAMAIRNTIATARALETAGRYTSGLAMAQSGVRQARALGDAATLAEALSQLGNLHERAGQWPESEASLEEAALLAVEAGHDEVAAVAMAQLVGIVGYLQARGDDGLVWARHAEAAYERARLGPAAAAQLTNNIGAVYWRDGDYARALEQYQLAQTYVAQPQDAGERHELASTLNNLGNALAMHGRFAEAQPWLEQAVEIMVEERGEGHPTVALTRANLGNVYLDVGKLDLAEHHHRRALDDRRTALGESHPLVASSYLNLGLTLSTRGEYEEALRYLERAAQLKEETVGPDHPDLALALNNLGESLREVGRYDDAIEAHTRAKEIWVASLGADHPYVAFPTSNLGLDLLESGKVEEARVHLERALEIRLAHPGDPALAAVTKLGLARALAATESEDAEATRLAREALDELEQSSERYHTDREDAAQFLAALMAKG